MAPPRPPRDHHADFPPLLSHSSLTSVSERPARAVAQASRAAALLGQNCRCPAPGQCLSLGLPGRPCKDLAALPEVPGRHQTQRPSDRAETGPCPKSLDRRLPGCQEGEDRQGPLSGRHSALGGNMLKSNMAPVIPSVPQGPVSLSLPGRVAKAEASDGRTHHQPRHPPSLGPRGPLGRALQPRGPPACFPAAGLGSRAARGRPCPDTLRAQVLPVSAVHEVSASQLE